MLHRTLLKGMAATAAAVGFGAGRGAAEEVLKMAVSIPLTGAGFNAVGRQLAAALKLYVAQTAMSLPGAGSRSRCATTAASPTMRAASFRK